MPTLSAKFTLNVFAPCLLSWPENSRPEFKVPIEDFQVAACLLPADYWRTQAKDDVNWTTNICALEITVSRDEPDSPPGIVITPEGTRDLTVRGEYLQSKLPQYRAAAFKVYNRILRFFQYSLCTPLVQQIPEWDQGLHNPTWFDSFGEELRGGMPTFVVQPIPGLRGELGAKKLTPNEKAALVDYVVAPSEPSLAETLLSDAQTAWFEGNLRRSVLELAICTEVMVKRRYFAQSSPAGAAFDYLEDKAKISVRVLDLLDAVAEEAFSRSYRKEEPKKYESIDHLFRCRNKIAHRGELAFRNDAGKSVNVGAAEVETWWHAVAHLKSWLDVLP